MADTERTLSDLLTNLFQDGQAAASITAQDMRDLLVSLRPQAAATSITVPAATTIAVAGTYYKAAGTTAIDAVAVGFDDDSGTSNRLRYIAAPTRHVTVVASLSMTCGSGNQVVGFKLAINGVVEDGSVTRVKLGVAGDVNAISLIAHADLSLNDYIEVFVTNETSTGAVTVENMHLHAVGYVNGS